LIVFIALINVKPWLYSFVVYSPQITQIYTDYFLFHFALNLC